MPYERKEITPENVAEQLAVCEQIRNLRAGVPSLALVDTYGCQQNEADSERLRGYLAAMGFAFTDNEAEADVIVVNTCAVREHAEMRVLGNVGSLNHTKKAKPEQIICMCGCMVQQPHMAEKIKRSYPIVNLVFGPHELWRFPEMLLRIMTRKGRVFEVAPSDGVVAEGMPIHRDRGVKAWLSIMYGCNNFCSYCVVPYVRGRERSRRAEDILEEARMLIRSGAKEITLLGQNVNSYGKDIPGGPDFADLIRMINDLEGDFLIRFMTSHPKDATEKLFRTMAECEKCAHQLHLPVQAGNDRVLKAMNRVYDSEAYLKKVELVRSYMPDVVLTSDIIVGFPGETDEEFEDTLRLVEKVRYDALFTFIYSKREGTPAAKMPDVATREDKQRRFDRLIELQNRISSELHAAYVGKTMRVLIDGENPQHPGELSARTAGGRLVHLTATPEMIGQWAQVRITGSNTWALYGQLQEA